MKFVSIRDFRTRTAAVRKDLEQDEDIVLTVNGRPVAIMTPVGPGDLEEELLAIRRARARTALDRIRSRARAAGTDELSMSEVDAVIAETRRERNRRSRRRK